MTLPDEIWEAARELRNRVTWSSNSSVEHIANALRARNERAAAIARSLKREPDPDSPDFEHERAANMRADVIAEKILGETRSPSAPPPPHMETRGDEKRRIYTYPPRGLARDEAARYVGVSSTLFDEMVADGRMPKPKRANSRVIWDGVSLDAAFSDLPGGDEGNQIDAILRRGSRAA